MTERRRYSNPPIEEALCEFHFAPGDEWDLTIPGKLHTQLEQDYPAKPMRQVVARVGLEVEGAGRVECNTKRASERSSSSRRTTAG